MKNRTERSIYIAVCYTQHWLTLARLILIQYIVSWFIIDDQLYKKFGEVYLWPTSESHTVEIEMWGWFLGDIFPQTPVVP